MFERYTEKARRVIFFARYKAAQCGSAYIESEHLLLGILREDKTLTNRFLRPLGAVETIRKRIEEHRQVKEKISTAVDLPLANESKRVLAYAAEEAERFGHKHVGTEHLLLGLLREETCFAASLLLGAGVRLTLVREQLIKRPHNITHTSEPLGPFLSQFSRDLCQAALEQELTDVVGREQELDELLEVLCSRRNRNAVLIGDDGVGKTAIVEGLAKQISDKEAPAFFSDRQIITLDIERLIGSMPDAQKLREQLLQSVTELRGNSEIILFINKPQVLFAGEQKASLFDHAFRDALTGGELQCILATTPDIYKHAVRAAPWIEKCFRTIAIAPLAEEDLVKLLSSHKVEYEKYHAVTYTDDALADAVRYAMRYFSRAVPLEAASDILDAAGTRVKLRIAKLPEEVTEVQKRIKFIVHRMENAITTHEFEKARFYSDEERKERENLRDLREKYHLDDSSLGIVTSDDIEGVVSRWTGRPVASLQQETTIPELRAAGDAVTITPKTDKVLRVFICHASEDKPAVRELYQKMLANHYDPWLDEEKILPGHKWNSEITKAVRSSHVVLVCLSGSASKAGYLQKEIKTVLDAADEQPDDTIYLIPVKLEECPVPDRLRGLQWVNLFEARGFERLLLSLKQCAHDLGKELPGQN